MNWFWNWGGECFGYREGDSVFTEPCSTLRSLVALHRWQHTFLPYFHR